MKGWRPTDGKNRDQVPWHAFLRLAARTSPAKPTDTTGQTLPNNLEIHLNRGSSTASPRYSYYGKRHRVEPRSIERD